MAKYMHFRHSDVSKTFGWQAWCRHYLCRWRWGQIHKSSYKHNRHLFWGTWITSRLSRYSVCHTNFNISVWSMVLEGEIWKTQSNQNNCLAASQENWYISVTESQNHIGWKGLQEVFIPTFCSKHKQLWGHTRLLRTLSSCILKTSKYKDGTSCLGNLLHYTIVITENKFFLIPSLVYLSCFSLYPLHLFFHYPPLWGVWICHFDNLAGFVSRLKNFSYWICQSFSFHTWPTWHWRVSPQNLERVRVCTPDGTQKSYMYESSESNCYICTAESGWDTAPKVQQ